MKNMKIIMENFKRNLAEVEVPDDLEMGDMPGDVDSEVGVPAGSVEEYEDFLRHLASMADDEGDEGDEEPLEEGETPLEEGNEDIASTITQELMKMTDEERDEFIEQLIAMQRRAADGQIDDMEADEAAEAAADMHDYAAEREEDEIEMMRR